MSEIEERDVDDARWFQANAQDGGIDGFAVSSITVDGKLSVDSIHVIPVARRKGIGAAIWEAIVSWGKKQGATEITGDFFPEYRGGQDEANARRFYEKRGIRIDENDKLSGRIG